MDLSAVLSVLLMLLGRWVHLTDALHLATPNAPAHCLTRGSFWLRYFCYPRRGVASVVFRNRISCSCFINTTFAKEIVPQPSRPDGRITRREGGGSQQLPGRPLETEVLTGWNGGSPAATRAATAAVLEPGEREIWTGDIPKRRLGSSSMEVSPISLGTMTFGEQTNEVEAHSLLDFAVKECGINLLDMAEMYPVPTRVETHGHTEAIVGRWLQRNPRWRERVYIATKVCGRSYGDVVDSRGTLRCQSEGKERQEDNQDCSLENRRQPMSMLQSCEGSLRRLQTDYIDLYQLHWPDRRVPLFGHTLYKYHMRSSRVTSFEEIAVGIKALFDSGKIRNWGLSNETPYGVAELVKCCDNMGIPRPVSIQASFNLLHRAQFEESLVESCAPWNYNVGLLSWSPLAGGMLTGKYLGLNDEASPTGPGDRFSRFPRFQPRWMNARCMEATRLYNEIAKQAGLSLNALALLWILSREYLSHGSLILGATTQRQLEQCMDIVRNARQPLLSENVLHAVDAVHLRCRDPSQEL
eukprot:GHVS01108312.1.p1 GENE.GHVS01108312.1~~GHVS01108312.1.p1  ORF type:complete len:525 (-),score=33.21 GHVS01108312.1:208-1782(-)